MVYVAGLFRQNIRPEDRRLSNEKLMAWANGDYDHYWSTSAHVESLLLLQGLYHCVRDQLGYLSFFSG